MKKNKQFESLTDPKFRTAEAKELKSVTGGLASDLNTDTITIYSNGTSENDGQQYPIDRGADE